VRTLKILPRGRKWRLITSPIKGQIRSARRSFQQIKPTSPMLSVCTVPTMLKATPIRRIELPFGAFAQTHSGEAGGQPAESKATPNE